jgi:AcrR family transcriptional regulator
MSTSDELILECTQMIATEGLQAFSLRKLADRVGIKAPSIYEHFEHKEALLDVARNRALTELGNAMASYCTGDDPRQRLITTAMGYLRFAEDHPCLFTLLFTELPSKRSGLKEPPKAASPYALLLTRVKDFLGDNCQDAEVMSLGIWSLVHGVAVLRHTHLRDFQAPLVAGAQINLEALLDAWAMK